ncbi:MAG: ABC transporter permease [Minwuia sp.]|uniref:ABC transporter permease n=1 Tax=Minwuia sp. TaxID=2493630 RepID=UPI003A8B9F98
MRRISLIIGGLLVGTVLLSALVSLVWMPHDPTAINVKQRFLPPSAEHWLGTDQLGRDLMSLLMAGAQSSALVAFLSVGIGGLTGALLGMAAAARGGLLEEAVMRSADLAFAFPALLFAIMLAAVYGPSLTNAILAIAFINVPIFARMTRAAANQIWVREYITAARAMGLSTRAIAWKHVLPNIGAILLIQATIEFAVAILAEAALSYLGLGVQPPTPSWGRMLAEAQTLLFLAPQLAIWPGLCIVAAVLGFNLLGDGLRDALDPRSRLPRVTTTRTG